MLAYARAEAADVIGVPPSLASLATRTEDGRTESENPRSIEKRKEKADDKERRIKRWNRGVVLAGQPSPLRKSRRRESYSKYRPSWQKGTIKSGWASDCEEPLTSASRVKRTRRLKIESKRALVRQRDALAVVNDRHDIPQQDDQPPAQPPARRQWRCNVQ